MALRSFLEDIFDDDIENIDYTRVINVTSRELNYDQLFREKSVLNLLIVSYIWTSCFGVAPTRIELQKAKRELQFFTAQNVIDWISSNTFLQYTPDLVQLKENELRNSYISFYHSLQDHGNVKRLIIEKLLSRYGFESRRCTTLLYKFYTEQIYKERSKAVFRNPFTGLVLQTNLPAIDLVTEHDAMQYSILADYYFMRRIVGTNIILLYGSAPDTLIKSVIDALPGNSVLFTTVANRYEYDVLLFRVENEAFYQYIPAVGQRTVIIDTQGKRDKTVSKSYANNSCYVITGPLDADSTLFNKLVVHDGNNPRFGRCTYELLYETPNPLHHLLTLPQFHTHYLKNWFMPSNQRYLLALSWLSRYLFKQQPRLHAPSKQAAHAVLIIDNRPNIMSVLSCLLAMHNVDSNWQLVICTRKENIAFYKELLGDAEPIFIDHALQYKSKFDIENYNIMLKEASFWKQLSRFDKALLIQDDGFLLRKGIDAFLQYDYVGAPWSPAHWENTILASITNPQLVGNGGFSLRSIATMIEICETCEEEKHLLFNKDLSPIPEDVYFAKCAYKLGKKIPVSAVALQFASEQMVNTHSIGAHKMWHYHPEDASAYFRALLDE